MSNNLDFQKELLERALERSIPEPRILMPTGHIQKKKTTFEVFLPNFSAPSKAKEAA
jgi:hypothetical protein